jgi:hypothetical protein
MLKFFHVARIFNFCTLLADFNHDFKHVVLFHLNELLGLPYMISSFHPKLNIRSIPLVAPYMSQIVHKGLVLHI